MALLFTDCGVKIDLYLYLTINAIGYKIAAIINKQLQNLKGQHLQYRLSTHPE
jgi:hypothetical protein